MNNKTLVIYHAGCWDGFCAAWVAKDALIEGHVTFHAAHYGSEPPEAAFDRDTHLYILDFSYPRDVMFKLAAMRHADMVVLDHHKTAEQALDGLEQELVANNCGNALSVTFDTNKSGGRLTWEYFYGDAQSNWLVDYTEDRDLWRHKLPRSRDVNAALRSYPLSFSVWNELDDSYDGTTVRTEFAQEGVHILRRERQIIDDHLKHAREIDLGGYKILAVNATVLNSEVAGELAVGRPFGACYFVNEAGERVWSLRSTNDGIDVAELAKTFGGGGHKHAAGFKEIQCSALIAERDALWRELNSLSDALTWQEDSAKPPVTSDWKTFSKNLLKLLPWRKANQQQPEKDVS